MSIIRSQNARHADRVEEDKRPADVNRLLDFHSHVISRSAKLRAEYGALTLITVTIDHLAWVMTDPRHHQVVCRAYTLRLATFMPWDHGVPFAGSFRFRSWFESQGMVSRAVSSSCSGPSCL